MLRTACEFLSGARWPVIGGADLGRTYTYSTELSAKESRAGNQKEMLANESGL